MPAHRIFMGSLEVKVIAEASKSTAARIREITLKAMQNQAKTQQFIFEEAHKLGLAFFHFMALK